VKKNIKIKRILLSLGSILLLLIVLLTATFLFWLGPTVKLLAEKVGSRALGVPISVEKLSINPRKGTLLLTGFEIGNHTTFGYSNTVSLAEVRIAIDMGTIFSDLLVIKEILIDSPHFVYEQNSATDNITEYATNIFAFANIDPNQPQEPKPEQEDDPDKEPKKVVVHQLRVSNIKIFLANTDHPDLDLYAGLEELTLSMTNGNVRIKNLTFSGSEPLSTPHIFTLESADIQLTPESIHSDKIIIKKIQITKPYAYYEQNSETDTLSEFMKIAESFTSKTAQNPILLTEETEPLAPDALEAPTPSIPTIELREFVIDDIQLHLINITHPELNILFRLEQFALNPISGEVQLNNLTLSNPKHLATPNIFELEAIRIKLDPASLTNDTVIINDVQVLKPYAFFEQNPTTDTITEFLRIADRITENTGKIPRSSTKKSETPEPKKETESRPPPIELHNLLVDDIQLKFLDTTRINAPTGLQTLASIDRISLKLVEGTLRIESIVVPNPAGDFITPHLFHLSEIDIAIDPESVFSDQIVIQKVYIDSPLIHLEQTETTGNVAELQKIAEGFIPPPPTIPSSTNSDPLFEEKTSDTPSLSLAEQPVILNTLIVTNLAINMTTPTNSPSTGVLGMKKIRPKGLLGLNDNTHPTTDHLTLISFNQLSVEPLKGLIRITNLNIGNPEGFAAENLITIEQFNVSLDPDSILSETLFIKNILITKPRVSYERQLATDNIKALQAGIETAVVKREVTLSNKAKTKPTVTATEVPAGQKVIIEHLLVQDGMVRAKLSALPAAPIPLPNIEMVDIGKEKGGASMGEALSKVYGTFYDTIIGSVSSGTGFAGDLLKGAGALTFDALGSVSGGRTDRLQEGLGLDQPAEDTEPEKKKKKRSRRSGTPRRFL